jgi:hypothetical protein
MAKDKQTKPENWVLLQEIYAAELARFHSPVPVLRVVRDKLKGQSYRYFDSDGVRHENDLSDDFIEQAEIHLDNSSAIWAGGVIFKSIDAQQQPAPIRRKWYGDHNTVSYEETRWGAYAIELAPAVVTIPSAPAPLPKRASAKGVLIEEINRRKATGEKLPCRAELARELALWMKASPAQSGNGIKPLHWRTIANLLSKCGL